jgi:NADPH-dependent F420 reductase
MDGSSIALIGGTGAQGKGLALSFARAGHRVVLGSRSSGRASKAADEVNDRLPDGAGTVTGADNLDASAMADVVLLAVPYEGHAHLLEELRSHLAGKTVISCVNPLGFDRQGPYGLSVPDGSAAEEAQRLLPESTLVGAFHHVSAVSLWNGEELHHEDVLVCGDDPEAKSVGMALARTVTGRDGVDAGPLRMARQLEPFTAVLINVNKRYRIRSGLLVAGLPGQAEPEELATVVAGAPVESS